MRVVGVPADPVPLRQRGGPRRRVREDVRDGLAVVAFSAVSSSVLAAALLLVTSWAG
ncbi:MAG: hypothetical protein M3211_07185 [Actinomycetota bacterium]|nr:hypothetical protein [Actinomycetota bacterium]